MRDLLLRNFQVKLLSLVAATFIWFTVRLANPPEVALVERDFPGLPITVMLGSDEAFRYKIEPWTAQVRLRGDPATFQNLREKPIEVFVNLTDTEKQTKGLRKRVQVYLPEGLRLMSVDPEEVTVATIERVPPAPTDKQ